jgi:peptide/nickel transport system substrate-binding protein
VARRAQAVRGATSALLSLVVVVTTLFVTKPPIFLKPPHLGYDFSYAYHAPTRRGGTVTVGLWGGLQTLAVFPGPLGPFETAPSQEFSNGLWNGCVVQLPDTTLGLAGWKADQCTEVPTIANGDESPDGRTTTLHIDPRAVWSDGTPITAADYLFTYHLLADPNILGGGPPLSQMRLTAPDQRTVRIDWSVAYGDYLGVVARLIPLPLHALATGQFSGVYNPRTDAYDSALAQRLVSSAAYNGAIPVDSGPFTVQTFDPAGGRAVLVRNPRFFSNFFHHPAALDGVTFFTVNPQWPHGPPKAQSVATLVADYRQSAVDLVDGLDPLYLGQVGGIPKAQVQTSPNVTWLDVEFNQRAAAPNAQANGGASIFADQDVRKAFVEAFDRCAAVRAQLGAVNCADPNLFTDEPTTVPAPDYDPSVKLPGYNPADAARLMDRAGYPVVNGVRRAKDGQTPLQITIDLSTYAAGVPVIAQRIEQDYGRNLQVGVTLVSATDFFVVPFSTANSAASGDFDIVLASAGGSPDPAESNALIYGPTDTADTPSAQNPFGGNYLGIVDPWVIQRAQLAGETLDSDQRASVNREIQRHMAQAFYVEPVFITADVVLVKPTMCNFKKWPSVGENTWNMADWYVAPSCP